MMMCQFGCAPASIIIMTGYAQYPRKSRSIYFVSRCKGCNSDVTKHWKHMPDDNYDFIQYAYKVDDPILENLKGIDVLSLLGTN